MLRFTFVYGDDDYCKYITTEFDNEKVALASELRNEPGFEGMNFFHLCFEADDLVDFARIGLEPCGEICDDPTCGPFA